MCESLRMSDDRIWLAVFLTNGKWEYVCQWATANWAMALHMFHGPIAALGRNILSRVKNRLFVTIVISKCILVFLRYYGTNICKLKSISLSRSVMILYLILLMIQRM